MSLLKYVEQYLAKYRPENNFVGQSK